ncbi:MAG: FAD-binding oxidoreductase, partial [Rhodobacteraceae bacterium]|nr:FAD-binding oxidoreductase [Paracoccaceae bacterium]
CILTFRDEAPLLLEEWTEELASRVMLFEEFLAMKLDQGLKLSLRTSPVSVRLHGHCHQKAFNLVGPIQRVLASVPGVETELIDSSCCGMAGAFGYQAETIDVSRAMGELSLLPAVRAAPDDAIILADGTSCRCQIADGAGRDALHVARFLADLL